MNPRGKGFSLIEVMVALVIMVIGLIGIFNLHIVAKRSSFESFQQTQASYYANDIINRMKLNRTLLGSYTGDYPAFTVASTPPSPSCADANCSPSQLVAWDLYEWRSAFSGEAEVVGAQNVGGLDTATACIKVNGNSVSVTMTWRGISETSDGIGSIACGTSSERRRAFTILTVI